MSGRLGRLGSTPAEAAELADLIAEAVTRSPAVAGLTQIHGFPVATHLPGRVVPGVAVRPGAIEVCVVARYGPPLPEVATQVREAVAPLAPGRAVDVVIADITPPGARPQARRARQDKREETANG